MTATDSTVPDLGLAPSAWRTSPWLPALVILSALAILGGSIALVRHQLRARIREQILTRDGTVLHAVTLLPQYDSELDDAEFASIGDPANQLTLMLRTSRLRGVLAARLFDASGLFVQSFPANVEEDILLPEQLETLQTLRPTCMFYPSVPPSAMWLTSPVARPSTEERAPVLEVNIPLHEPGGSQLLGVAQFLIDGTGMAAEFERLDRYLAQQALLYFGVGGSLLGLVIGLSFHQLRKSARLLEQRSRDLLQVNRELVMSAKTSAVGAVTSHLIHELKNPLSGLHGFLSSCARNGSGSVTSEDWTDAVSATRRMQATIQEIVTLLREEQSGLHYSLSLTEMSNMVVQRLSTQASDKRVALAVQIRNDCELPGRIANLVVLILVNLGRNAIQASPADTSVLLEFDGAKGGGEFCVQDSGDGFRKEEADRLFHPRASTHEGGTGIGLAICKQLANHLAASLELEEKSGVGCRFILRLTRPEPSPR
jgi:signal transduction histidine kinase